jgi:[ribosomal protein S5]-alanine N-acetyltransferase
VFPPEFPVLETERLVLRQLEPGDATAIFAIKSDAETMRYMDTPPLADVSEAEASLASAAEGFAAGDSLKWAVTLRGQDELIGECTLFRIRVESRRAEIGYYLARPHWGNGYNHEALTRIVEYGFNDLGLNRIEADLDPRNVGSARAVHRLGFVDEGLLRERWIVSGEVSDSLLVGLLRSDWEARRG